MALRDVLTGGANLVTRSLIRPTKAVDVVAITGPGFSPIFAGARPLVAEVHESAALMEHPLETGAVIADHIVFDPTEISLPVVCVGEEVYRNTYALIRAAFKAGTILTVTTRTGSYPSMVIIEMPHEETPGAFDAIAIRILLREAVFVKPATGSLTDTKDAKQSSTQSRGGQQTTNANASQSSKASSSYGQSGAGTTPTPQGSTLRQWYDAA